MTNANRPGLSFVISPECTYCGVCEFMCPEAAIKKARNQFVIRRQLCNGCGECAPYCPERAIVPAAEFAARQK